MSHLALPLELSGAPALRERDSPGVHGLARRLRLYLAVTDPKSVSLLVFTALAAGIVGGGLHAPARLLGIGLALALSCMGARAVANYIDRDIDALMERTRRRPLPSGQLPPAHALLLGSGLIAAGLLAALTFGPLVVLLISLGLADNLIVYALLTKRTSPLSIVLGAPSGGAPAFVGYVAVTGAVTLPGILLATFVMLWTPIHIWSLAIRSRDDYARANVPMLPVAIGVRRSARYIGLASLALAGFTVLFLAAPGAHVVLPIASVVLGLAVALVLGSVWLVRAPSKEHAWSLFKFTSPYLAVLFGLLALNAIVVG
jgi:protoheme IX farnesyltransferase